MYSVYLVMGVARCGYGWGIVGARMTRVGDGRADKLFVFSVSSECWNDTLERPEELSLARAFAH